MCLHPVCSQQAAGLWALVGIPLSLSNSDVGPKKRRRTRRNRVRPVTQSCRDTIEETISSTDEVTPQRKRARVYKGSPPSSTTHTLTTFNTSSHLHITTSHSNNRTSHRTIFHTPLGLFSPVFGSKQIKQTSAMSSFVLCLRLPCSTPRSPTSGFTTPGGVRGKY